MQMLDGVIQSFSQSFKDIYVLHTFLPKEECQCAVAAIGDTHFWFSCAKIVREQWLSWHQEP